MPQLDRWCRRGSLVAAAFAAAVAVSLVPPFRAAIALAAAGATVAPDLSGPVVTESEVRDVVERYEVDHDALERRYPVRPSAARLARLRQHDLEWKARVEAVDFDGLGVEGRIDHVLLRNRIDYDVRLLDREARRLEATATLVPFAPAIAGLEEARIRMETPDPVKAASTLAALAEEIDAVKKRVEAGLASRSAAGTPPRPGKSAPAPLEASGLAAFRAQEVLLDLGRVLDSWYRYYAGYDPLVTWWAEAPQKKARAALDAYRTLLREKALGIAAGDDDPIVGTPIGRDALVADLASELIPYTPEDLLAVADREFAWCENELKKAAREMGLGDDTKAAVEKVKTLYVAPGRQPDLVRDLAREAEAYVEENDLVTVPPLAKEVWRMEMMSAERQKVNPFFTGGETISVSYPTAAMDHADKLMSLRGNNIHFARATVFHELIPGHHLQGFMTTRYNPQRRAFDTPFWGEGWALYWEMLLWDRGFARGPEDRVGMLFWRMHRAARIIFSLRFHLGTWTPAECIDFLVDRVGHERANAAAEVRRSFNGTYPPLYQLAYMMGGLQFRALHRELVESGKMTDRAFHDAVLTGGSMPVEMVRVHLTKTPLARDHRASWKYAGEAPAARR